MPEKEIQTSFAPPDSKSWLEYSWKIQQEAPNRFEDAAKFLATIISLSITLFFTATEKLKLLVPDTRLVLLIFLFWLVALFFAFFVLFPFRYKFHSKSVERIKEMQDTIVKQKKHVSCWQQFYIFYPLYFSSLNWPSKF